MATKIGYLIVAPKKLRELADALQMLSHNPCHDVRLQVNKVEDTHGIILLSVPFGDEAGDEFPGYIELSCIGEKP